MAFSTGLVSVTFRKLSPREVVDLVHEARLEGVEWGGDIHVPPGDEARAREVAAMMHNAGLKSVAYGSYFRVGEDPVEKFPAVIQAARTIKSPCIRVWAGRKASADAEEADRARVVEDSLQLARLVHEAGLTIAYEYHANTLTDTDESTTTLLDAADHPAIRTLWQPPVGRTIEQNRLSLRLVLPRLHHVHVYHWPERGVRAPLADGAQAWQTYIQVLHESGHACPLLLEFVKDDNPQQFLQDARTLRAWVEQMRDASGAGDTSQPG
jgi:3-dehydroshikimate dehydratase